MRSVDMRYRYQIHELNVPFPSGLDMIYRIGHGSIYPNLFDDLYEKAFGQGSGYREAGKEDSRPSGLRQRGCSRNPTSRPKRWRGVDGSLALNGEREVYFEENGKFMPTRVYDFDQVCGRARNSPGPRSSKLQSPRWWSIPATARPWMNTATSEFRRGA